MVQTGKNLPPDQNTPTGMPEQQEGEMPEQNSEGVKTESGSVPDRIEMPGQGDIADPASPAKPGFDLGADDEI
jgi:hypothetical protein